ncbi:MAG: PLP-dependent transferase, partial [Akkermansiaceae bacterium]|nr:PLP-dependent transferase [Akkermansiaceae bacterium]
LRGALEEEIPGGARLYSRDAETLLANAQGFRQRVADSNRGGEKVAEFLAEHPAIDRVWYPKFVDREAYQAIRTEHGGFGGLMSFTLKD